MIISRTPLRVSLGGGGTDLPSYYQRFGGIVVAAAIDRYIYVGVNRTFTDDYFIKYSALERVSRPEDIEHPIVRETLKLHEVGPAVEIVSLADIPAGTGLGSSGSFTVGLLRSVYAFRREHVTPISLAEEACRIEIDILGRPVGKQDPFAASFGGLMVMDIDKEGVVSVSPLRLSNDTLHDLEEHLLMFFTGYSREASSVLGEQKERSERGDDAMLENLHFIKQTGVRVRDALEAGDTHQYAALMHEHWLRKRERSQGISNPDINRWYELARDNGALGGKLVGAGGGGFLLLYALDPSRLRQALGDEGLREVRFSFDHDGAVVTARD